VTFTTGLFTLDLDAWQPSPTVAWAECDVDLMNQPIVRFHYVVADGFGTDTFGWYDSVYLRVDYLSARLDLVLEVEGEWSVEASFPIDELHDALGDARIGDADPQDLLVLMLGAARERVRVRPLTADDIARVDELPLIADSTVEDEVRDRGCWEPPPLLLDEPGGG
jgi:hypothetical protein